MNKKITFYTQLYYPDQASTAILMTDLTKDIAFLPLDISVVCAQPTYFNKNHYLKNEVLDNVSINRIASSQFNKNWILGRIINGTICFVSMLFHALFKDRSDLLVLNTNPIFLSCIGLICRTLTHKKYVVLIHDLWPELLVTTGFIKKNDKTYKIIDFINSKVFERACQIVVLSESMKKAVLKKAPCQEKKIAVIPNWADKNRIFPFKKKDNKLINKWGLEKFNIVMYSGNIGRYQPIEIMLQAAGLLKKRQDIKFVFVGEGKKKDKLQKIIKTLKFNNVLMFPFQPIEMLPHALSLAHVNLVGIYPENEGVVMPSKLYSLLAAGKPILSVSSETSEVAKIVKKAGAGFQASVISAQDIADKIVDIIDHPYKAQKMGESGRRYFLKHFEREIITRKWKELLESI